MPVSVLEKFGTDVDGNGRLEEWELNDQGKKAVARGFHDYDSYLECKTLTPELAAKAAKEVDGKFTLWPAIKEGGRGLLDTFVRPFKEHPVRSTALVGGLVGLILAVPAAAPIAAGLGALFGLYKVGKGVGKLVGAIKRKDGDDAESAFRDIVPGALITGACAPTVIGKGLELAGASSSSVGGAGAASGAAGCAGGG